MHRLPARSLSWAAAAAALVTFASSAAAQGDNGFLRGEGRADISLSYSVEKFEHFWVDDHKVSDPGIGKVYRTSYNLWVAYGVRDDLDVVFSTSIVNADAKGTANLRDHQALTDGVFGAKWRFVNAEMGPGTLSVLATPALKIPLYHYQANAVTALGDGQVDYRLRGVVQYTATCGAYAAIETGYDVRTEGTPNEVPIHVSVGATVFDCLTITPFMSWVNALGGPDIGQDDFPDVEEDFTRGGVGLYLRLNDRIGATAGYKTTFQGSNTADSWSYWVGLVFRI